MNAPNKTSRRHFLASSTAGALAGAGLMGGSARLAAKENEEAVATDGRGSRNRVGAVAYGYQYSIGLFSYRDRPGEKFDAVKFVEANHAAQQDRHPPTSISASRNCAT